MAHADISITFNDAPDDLPDEGFEQGDCSSSVVPGDDSSLTPLLRVQKYAESGDIYDRHAVPKVVQDIFGTAPADILDQQLPEIMKVLTKCADDAMIKTEVLDHIPNIAAQALENSERVAALKNVIGDYLIPLVVRNLGCSDSPPDRKAQSTLIQMFERGYVSQFEAEIKVCPSILALTNLETQVDVNNGAVMLMSKLAPLLGKDITERILLKRFTELCSSNLFCIRKSAASHFGHYCAVVGRDAFEKSLLPCYLTLCSDEIWGVRKSCAEVIMYVSCVCSPDLRISLLAEAFCKLLQDECRWVKITAFQTLGGFISTFAEPPLTTIGYNQNGDLVMINQEGFEFHPGGVDGFSMTGSHDFLYFSSPIGTGNDCANIDEDAVIDSLFRDRGENSASTPKTEEPQKSEALTQPQPLHEDELLQKFSEYNYWYISPPQDVDLDGLLDAADTSSNHVSDRMSESSNEDIVTNHLEELYCNINLDDSNSSLDKPESIEPSSDNDGDKLDNSTSDVSNVNTTQVIEAKEPPQKIVPQQLIDYYVSMAQTDANFGDTDHSFHCAYSLPAVVLTLGKDNWPLLKGTVQTLAGHLSYKIRRTVASSLHEIAQILGPQIATQDLSPLFEGFLKDLDEVRIGILNNLSHFMQLITADKRQLFLPKLSEFLRVDNVCNWRFQEALAEQLQDCLEFFDSTDIVKHIGLYAQALMSHNVASVRQAAIILVTEIVGQISSNTILTSSFLSVVAERFAHSKKWKPRQTFGLLCIQILKANAMQIEEFNTLMLPHLLDLSWDRVANVRHVVGNCLVKELLVKDYFTNPEDEECLEETLQQIYKVLSRLRTDEDREVRLSAEQSIF